MTSSGLYEFGPFRLDVEQRVFTRAGEVLPLAPKTFDLLVLLLQRPGHAFSKRELMSALWPDAFVEEANLSFQVSTLRKAMGEGAAHWIETLPKHGYRFSEKVRAISPLCAPGMEARPAPQSAPTLIPQLPDLRSVSQHPRKARLPLVVASSLSLLLIGTAAAFLWSKRGERGSSRDPGVPAIVRLTSNPAQMSVTSAHISPDGRYLAYADPTGLQVRTIDTGQTHRLVDTRGMDVYGWTAESSGLLTSQCDDISCTGWVISLVGQERRRNGAKFAPEDQMRAAPVDLIRFGGRVDYVDL